MLRSASVNMEAIMVPVRHLFETHLTVVDLQRSMTFFSQVLRLELAAVFWERKVAFYWIGGRGNSMLGLWEVGTGSPEAKPSPCLQVGSLGSCWTHLRAFGLPMLFRSTF